MLRIEFEYDVALSEYRAFCRGDGYVAYGNGPTKQDALVQLSLNVLKKPAGIFGYEEDAV